MLLAASENSSQLFAPGSAAFFPRNRHHGQSRAAPALRRLPRAARKPEEGRLRRPLRPLQGRAHAPAGPRPGRQPRRHRQRHGARLHPVRGPGDAGGHPDDGERVRTQEAARAPATEAPAERPGLDRPDRRARARRAARRRRSGRRRRTSLSRARRRSRARPSSPASSSTPRSSPASSTGTSAASRGSRRTPRPACARRRWRRRRSGTCSR